MPFKIASFVFTGHSGGLKQEKPEAGPGKGCMLTPRPGKPLGLSVRRATPFTNLPSDASVNRKLLEVPEFESVEDVSDRCVQHFGRCLEAARAEAQRTGQPIKPLLIIVGEHHESRTSVMVGTALLAEAAKQAGPQGKPRMLYERDEDQMRLLKKTCVPALKDAWDPKTSDDVRSQIARDKTRVNDGPANSQGRLAAIKIRVAESAGFATEALDLGAMTDYLDQREVGMLRVIRDAIKASEGAPVVVFAGSHHVGTLHDALKGESTCISTAYVLPYFSPDSLATIRKRTSYVLSEPGVMPYRGSNAVENEFDFVQYAKGLGIDVTSPG